MLHCELFKYDTEYRQYIDPRMEIGIFVKIHDIQKFPSCKYPAKSNILVFRLNWATFQCWNRKSMPIQCMDFEHWLIEMKNKWYQGRRCLHGLASSDITWAYWVQWVIVGQMIVLSWLKATIIQVTSNASRTNQSLWNGRGPWNVKFANKRGLFRSQRGNGQIHWQEGCN